MTDVLAALDRASVELSPELQVFWMRFRGCVFVDTGDLSTPTPFVVVGWNSHTDRELLAACGYGKEIWQKFEGPALEMVRFLTEFFDNESQKRYRMMTATASSVVNKRT